MDVGVQQAHPQPQRRRHANCYVDCGQAWQVRAFHECWAQAAGAMRAFDAAHRHPTCRGAFPDAALAGRHRDHVLHLVQAQFHACARGQPPGCRQQGANGRHRRHGLPVGLPVQCLRL